MEHLPDFGLSKVPRYTEFGMNLYINFKHFIEIQNIIKMHGGVRNYEGSYLMDGVTLSYCERMFEKQDSLYEISKEKKRILEVGVNSGHSLLIMLLANNKAIFDVFDICMYSYTVPCIEYLNKHFNNRIFLHTGDSKYTLPHFIECLSDDVKYDLFHSDGMHSEEYVYDEIKSALRLSDLDTHIVVDDYCSEILKSACDYYENKGKIKPFRTTTCYAFHIIFSVV